jgi:hypothetical protein
MKACSCIFFASLNIYFFKRLYTSLQLQLSRLQISGSQVPNAHSKKSQYIIPQPERHIGPNKKILIFRVSRLCLCQRFNAYHGIETTKTIFIRCVCEVYSFNILQTHSNQRRSSIFCRNAGTIYRITQFYNLITSIAVRTSNQMHEY